MSTERETVRVQTQQKRTRVHAGFVGSSCHGACACCRARSGRTAGLVVGWRITDEGFFAAVPTEVGPDGHFAAVLERC